MKNRKTLKVLKSLIAINNDRIKGYETALEVTQEQDLKTLFEQLISTSQKCKQELVTEVNSLGGEQSEESKLSGKFFRDWMDVKAALSSKDSKIMLYSCEYIEHQVQETYNNVLENELENLSLRQQFMVSAHRSILKADQNHLKALRDSL